MESPVNLQRNDCKPTALMVERQKCVILNVLYGMGNSAAADGLQFWRRPDMVRSGDKAIGANQLTLVPFASLANITTKSGSGISLGMSTCGDYSVEFFITPPAKPHFNPEDPARAPTDAVLSSFWWVSKTSVEADVNMYMEEKDV